MQVYFPVRRHTCFTELVKSLPVPSIPDTVELSIRPTFVITVAVSDSDVENRIRGSAHLVCVLTFSLLGRIFKGEVLPVGPRSPSGVINKIRQDNLLLNGLTFSYNCSNLSTEASFLRLAFEQHGVHSPSALKEVFILYDMLRYFFICVQTA